MDKPQFVAEVSSNHNQDLARCLDFVDTSAAIGCRAVKFQLFKIDELFSPEILKKSKVHCHRKKLELPPAFLPAIVERCRKNNIAFACTPFYLEAVDQLLPYVDFYKIASYELLWNDLLVKCAMTEKPIVLSTGMSTFSEVQTAVDVLLKAGCRDLTLLQCVSSYPTPASNCNLSAIKTLRDRIHCIKSGVDIRSGWSDHSVSPGVIYRAAHHWRADMIEFHFDLEGQGAEYSGGHCWLPEKMQEVIRSVKEGLEADGRGIKEPIPAEMSDRHWRADPEDGLRPLKHIRASFQPCKKK